jgi:hypothetical protein
MGVDGVDGSGDVEGAALSVFLTNLSRDDWTVAFFLLFIYLSVTCQHVIIPWFYCQELCGIGVHLLKHCIADANSWNTIAIYLMLKRCGSSAASSLVSASVCSVTFASSNFFRSLFDNSAPWDSTWETQPPAQAARQTS